MTKAVTSTAAVQMAEQGKLQLDQPIVDVLPELSSPQVLEGFDASDTPRGSTLLGSRSRYAIS